MFKVRLVKLMIALRHICGLGLSMSLPYCHSRRDLPDEPGVFFCAHPAMHAIDQRVRANVCRVCDMWQQPAPLTFREVKPRQQVRNCACIHLGELIGERECSSCRGRVRVKVYSCQHPDHDEVTWPECLNCRDYTADTDRPITKAL